MGKGLLAQGSKCWHTIEIEPPMGFFFPIRQNKTICFCVYATEMKPRNKLQMEDIP